MADDGSSNCDTVYVSRMLAPRIREIFVNVLKIPLDIIDIFFSEVVLIIFWPMLTTFTSLNIEV